MVGEGCARTQYWVSCFITLHLIPMKITRNKQVAFLQQKLGWQQQTHDPPAPPPPSTEYAQHTWLLTGVLENSNSDFHACIEKCL